MNPIFSTKEFAFGNKVVSIYRNTKIEDMPFESVSMIELKKGSDLKRPKLAVLFGVALIILALKILSTYNFDLGEFFASGAILRILGVLFFIGGIGVYSVYSGLPIHPIIEIHVNDSKENFSIATIVKKGFLRKFSDFLQEEFGPKFRNTLG